MSGASPDNTRLLDLGVVVPTYRSPDSAAPMLESLARQTVDRPFAVVIAANGPATSMVAQWVAAAERHLGPRGCEVRVVTSAKGVSPARRAGAQAIETRDICFLDDDDYVSDNYLAAMSAALEDSPLVAAVLDNDSTPAGILRRMGVGPGQTAVRPSLGRTAHSLSGRYYPGIASVGMRRELFLEADGEHLDFGSPGGEDELLLYRMVTASGCELSEVAEASYHYALRNGFRAAFRQHRSYGKGHAELYRRAPEEFRSARVRGQVRYALGAIPLLLRRVDLPLAIRTGYVAGLAAGGAFTQRRALMASVGDRPRQGIVEAVVRRQTHLEPIAHTRSTRAQLDDRGVSYLDWVRSFDRVVLLSPHLDDVGYSAVELLTAGPPATVVTVFTDAPPAPHITDWDRSAGFTTSAEAMAARRQEDRDALGSLAAELVHLGLIEFEYTRSALRAEDADLVWKSLSALGVGTPGTLLAVPAGLGNDRYRRRLRRWLRAWVGLPPGCPPHRDHRELRDAIAARARVDHAALTFYGEQPYLWATSPDEALAACETAAGQPMELATLPVDPTRKLSVVGAYASQGCALFGPNANLAVEFCSTEWYWRPTTNGG
ncbi:MAG: glycosyltransferase family 2 protein [Acidimicrobiia bacterium]